jgi:hypothetical protein
VSKPFKVGDRVDAEHGDGKVWIIRWIKNNQSQAFLSPEDNSTYWLGHIKHLTHIPKEKSPRIGDFVCNSSGEVGILYRIFKNATATAKFGVVLIKEGTTSTSNLSNLKPATKAQIKAFREVADESS